MRWHPRGGRLREPDGVTQDLMQRVPGRGGSAAGKHGIQASSKGRRLQEV